MSRPILECIPNFSEGRDKQVIRQITAAIASVKQVQLLHVDPGLSANRTVVTFAGDPEAVIEAAFLGIQKAAELIDMRLHTGTHPRMGATDVCPLVPISGILLEQALELADRLAARVGNELGIPVYLYEKSAKVPDRGNLAVIRSGEYEGFREKITLPQWKPDYGPQRFHESAGQTVIGVRDFLVAYNVNLNTKSVKLANAVAFDIREKGRVKTLSGKPLLDPSGQPVREPGRCKAVKAIGWYIEEYGIAQVSTNLTDIAQTPVHVAFEAACTAAAERGMRVTGSELIGMIPLKCLTDAGQYYLQRQGLSQQASEEELVHIAIKSLGLDDLCPFDPQEKIIEYRLRTEQNDTLSDLSLRHFLDLLASGSPTPGGGSAAALVGAIGASLGTMIAHLSAGKRGWEDQAAAFGEWARKGQDIKDRLLHLVQEDSLAFEAVMAAYKLPKKTSTEISSRNIAVENAAKRAAEVPLQTIETAFEAYELLEQMAKYGTPHAVTDAGAGAFCIDAAISAAALNIRINLREIHDSAFLSVINNQMGNLLQRSKEACNIISLIAEGKI